MTSNDKDRKQHENHPRELPNRKDPAKDPAPTGDEVPREDGPGQGQENF